MAAVEHRPRAAPAGWERRGIVAVPAAVAGIIVSHVIAKVGFYVLGSDQAIPALALAAIVIAVALAAAFGVAVTTGHARRLAIGTLFALATLAAVAVASGPTAAVVLVTSVVVSAFLEVWGMRVGPELLPSSLDGVASRRRARTILWVVLAAVAMIQTVRLSSFMVDFSFRSGSTFPPDDKSVKHMCLSAYVYAADLNRSGVANIYDERLYPAFHRDEFAVASPTVRGLAEHLEDPYVYPPTFLLLPHLAIAVFDDFSLVRAVWFALQALIIASTAIAVARWIGGREGLIAGLVFPAVWISVPTMLGLQFGQIQLLTISVTLLALVLFEQDKRLAAAALLAAACSAKIFPGIVLLHLAARRRWADVLATAGFMLGYVALGFIVLGQKPFSAFLDYELPRHATGEAFSFFEKSTSMIMANASVYGMVFKLARLGVGDGSRALASAISYLFLGGLAVATILVARRNSTKLAQAQIWLALLNLAALRAPFAPVSYVPASTLWMLSLLSPELRARTTRVVLLVVTWLVVSGLPPAPSATFNWIASFVVQGALMGANIWTLGRRRREDTQGTNAPRSRATTSAMTEA